ncbi:MAG: response regulator transcription factor [Muribaculaceae bacterium]|nr:response regulator transcription factor [Muribaculaceae bacterium]
MKQSVVILLHDTLQSIGIREILRDSFGIEALCLQSVDEMSIDVTKDIDCFVVDNIHFLANIRFFLPQQTRTLVVTDVPLPQAEYKQITPNDTEQEIVKTLSTFFEQSQEPQTQSSVLSQRETEVLILIATGHINKEIADRLGISLNTVLTHRKNITAKLGIKSVSGLTFYAMMNGLVTPH